MPFVVDLAYLLLIGLVAGFVAATLMGERRRYSIVGYIAVGVVGAIAGRSIFEALSLPNIGTVWRLVAGVAGAIVLILLLRLFRRSDA